MACSGLLHGVTAGCVLPSFDIRQLKIDKAFFFLPSPWYDTLRFWCLKKFAQVSRQLQQNSAIEKSQLEDAVVHAIMIYQLQKFSHSAFTVEEVRKHRMACLCSDDPICSKLENSEEPRFAC